MGREGNEEPEWVVSLTLNPPGTGCVLSFESLFVCTHLSAGPGSVLQDAEEPLLCTKSTWCPPERFGSSDVSQDETSRP